MRPHLVSKEDLLSLMKGVADEELSLTGFLLFPEHDKPRLGDAMEGDFRASESEGRRTDSGVYDA